ncbi:MAG: hypothetical protein FJ319_04215 [SAR202 cluster bacterium]|nr:hypothetical protein [SAR202 cluster bacterium]
MFGPTVAFLKYVTNLLPSLGHRNIRQMTLRDWMESRLSESTVIAQTDRHIHGLVTRNRKPTQLEERAELYKGSRAMAELLERFVDERKRDVLQGATSILAPTTELNRKVVLPKADVIQLAREALNRPWNSARRVFANDAVNALQKRAGLGRTGIDLAPIVENAIASFWPQLRFAQEYRRFLKNTGRLISLGRESVDSDLAAALAMSIGNDAEPFNSTDLPALLYLDRLLNLHPKQGFQHIVVDEAQDVSPMEILLLKQDSSNGSFTIMGDIRQSLFPHRGIKQWREITTLFQRTEYVQYESPVSYRSTAQITRFANRILRQLPGGSSNPPEAYHREGLAPTFVMAPNNEAMISAIAKQVQSLRPGRDVTVAVLHRWARDRGVIAKGLTACGVEDVTTLESGEPMRSKVVVGPVIVAKGLEFDAVILAGVNDSNYLDEEFDTRLLYLGCTRARHELHFHWSGRLAQSLIVAKGQRSV